MCDARTQLIKKKKGGGMTTMSKCHRKKEPKRYNGNDKIVERGPRRNWVQE